MSVYYLQDPVLHRLSRFCILTETQILTNVLSLTHCICRNDIMGLMSLGCPKLVNSLIKIIQYKSINLSHIVFSGMTGNTQWPRAASSLVLWVIFLMQVLCYEWNLFVVSRIHRSRRIQPTARPARLQAYKAHWPEQWDDDHWQHHWRQHTNHHLE